MCMCCCSGCSSCGTGGKLISMWCGSFMFSVAFEERDTICSLLHFGSVVVWCEGSSRVDCCRLRDTRHADCWTGAKAPTMIGQAAESLYIGEKTFEWLKLLSFLPEHLLPPPLHASLQSGEEREKLVKSFISSMNQVPLCSHNRCIWESSATSRV